MIDKNFCLNLFIAFRYIFKEGIDFYNNMKHENFELIPIEEKIPVKTAEDIDFEIKKQFDKLYQKYDKIGILLSDGMNSGILASYLKPRSNAYRFSTIVSEVYNLEIVDRAKKYCNKFSLNMTYIDISFEDYKKYTPIVMETKATPIHSIEPQIYKAALNVKLNSDDLIIVGESVDLIFGEMDKLISKDWKFNDFVKRYTLLEPELVLTNTTDVSALYERYRLDNGKIDFLKFMDSSEPYLNAFNTANQEYYDPHTYLIMENKLDSNRIRNGESKYLIRELYSIKYPEKIPMPRPVDLIFKNWEGAKRKEFKMDILTGNQKWQLWCAELFLN